METGDIEEHEQAAVRTSALSLTRVTNIVVSRTGMPIKIILSQTNIDKQRENMLVISYAAGDPGEKI